MTKTVMMKNILRLLLTVFIAGIAGVVSFYITHSLEVDKAYTRQSAMRNWLAFTNEQDKAIRQSDPDFDTKAAELSMAFIAERQQLARLLDASGSTDEQITAQVEKVIEARFGQQDLFKMKTIYDWSKEYLNDRPPMISKVFKLS